VEPAGTSTLATDKFTGYVPLFKSPTAFVGNEIGALVATASPFVQPGTRCRLWLIGRGGLGAQS
jgi:hypothetical protein